MDIASKVHELKELKLVMADLEDSIKEIEEDIKAEMTARNVSEIVVDIFKIRWTTYTTSRIDTTALKAELPDIAARYTKTTESRRFTIT